MTPTKSVVDCTTGVRTRDVLPRSLPWKDPITCISEVEMRRVPALIVQIHPCGFRVSFSNQSGIGEIYVLDSLRCPR